MRRAEIARLAWRNVDLATARLTVNRQILSVEYKLIQSDLKTPTSRRTIDLDPHTVTQLRLHRRRQLENRLATGHRHTDSYVFAKPTAPPSTPTSSAKPSNASSPNSTCPASAYTTYATPTPPSCCNKASTPKSSANASATPASHSPWTSTSTSYPACKSKPPLPSAPPSSATTEIFMLPIVGPTVSIQVTNQQAGRTTREGPSSLLLPGASGEASDH